jgi:hypothetical protein
MSYKDVHEVRYEMELFTRREFIRMGIGVAGSFLLFRSPLHLISGAREPDWEAPSEGRVSFVLGDVFLNDQAALEGDTVSEGDVIRTGPDSEADVEIKDFSIFHIKENTEVQIEDILTSPKVKVKKGWFLIIVRKDTTYEVDTPTVLAGVRGTVFFFKVYDDDTAYVCDCNGKIELFDSRSGESLKLIKSNYHTAFDLKREGSTMSVMRTKVRYHEDSDILRMAGRFPQETRVIKDKSREKGAY